MNSITSSSVQKYKECARKGCGNIAVHKMEIAYLHKLGWFCDSCRCRLLSEGLVLELDSTCHYSPKTSTGPKPGTPKAVCDNHFVEKEDE